MSRHPSITLSCAALLFLLVCPSESQAQCSSGSRGMGPGSQGIRSSGSSRGLSMASSAFGSPYANRGMAAPPNLQMQQQTQQVANNYRMQNLRMAQDQQSLMATRQARAEQTRQYRADRIARAQALREARRVRSTGENDAIALVSIRETPK